MFDSSEPHDFRDECDALFELLLPLTEQDFDRETAFKRWTIGDVVTHLHVWNDAAAMSLGDPPGFRTFVSQFLAARDRLGLRAFEDQWIGPLTRVGLLQAWRKRYVQLAKLFAEADPKQRVQWVGVDMSARSSISARLMETWAHGQAVYDLMGIERVDTDRIRPIAVLGVNTFTWSFGIRGETPPVPVPQVRLRSPSGASWTWGDPSDSHLVEGSAVEFCQVVTQTRNVADTALRVEGDSASRWMAQAQCFAGVQRSPPPPGTRRRLAPQDWHRH